MAVPTFDQSKQRNIDERNLTTLHTYVLSYDITEEFLKKYKWETRAAAEDYLFGAVLKTSPESVLTYTDSTLIILYELTTSHSPRSILNYFETALKTFSFGLTKVSRFGGKVETNVAIYLNKNHTKNDNFQERLKNIDLAKSKAPDFPPK